MTSKRCATQTGARVGNRSSAAHGGLAAAFLLCSCLRGQAQFEVKQVSNVPKDPLAVSLLGAYQDGGMNAAIGSAFAHDLSGVLATEPCVAGFNEQLQALNPEGFSALQAEAASRGVDEELLRRIAPAATGDVILVLHMSGRLTTGEEEEEAPSPPSEKLKPGVPESHPDPSAPHRGAGFGRHAPATAPSSTAQDAVALPVPDLEVAAYFYSLQRQHTVSFVSMTYTGSSLEDGLRQLAEKLAALFPHAVCSPWNWQQVRVVHEHDAAGLPLPFFHLVRTN